MSEDAKSIYLVNKSEGPLEGYHDIPVFGDWFLQIPDDLQAIETPLLTSGGNNPFERLHFTVPKETVEGFMAYPKAENLLIGYFGFARIADVYGETDQYRKVGATESARTYDLDVLLLELLAGPSKFGICGCGDPGLAICALSDVLESHLHDHPVNECKDWREGPIHAYALLIRYLLDARGLTEHGGSVYGGWLENNGVAFYLLCKLLKIAYQAESDQ